ncbi:MULTISPECIES: hypothetical protein [Actinomycetes]|uniref:hypothetical protein n=1 Tax=Actinomycetes TaxID=1760 RepID=UPI00389A8C77
MIVASRLRSGQGIAAVGRAGIILGAVVLISGASSLVSTLIAAGPTGAGGAVAFLQAGLWWYMGALAVLSVIIGGARMAWEQRAEPGREALKSLLTLIIVAGAGVTVVGLLITASDSFSVWIINKSLDCDVATAGSTCFGTNILNLLALTTNPAAGGLGSLLIIILGLIAILATAFQIVLMIARGGMLVILTGILPLSASFTNLETGKAWFRKNVGWLLAFILYKPAAALVYAAAFQLVGTNVFKDDGTGLLSVLTGLMLMIIALVAMPALMRFVTPLVGSMAGGAGGAMGVAAVAALPTGAAALGRLGTGSGGSDAGGASGGGGSTGSPSGSRGGGSGSAGDAAPAAASGGGGASTGAAKAGGAAAGSGGGAAAGGAAAGGGGAAAGGAAAGASAGAAAGPIGMGVGAAAGVVADGAKKASQAVQSVGEQSTEGGPSGGR